MPIFTNLSEEHCMNIFYLPFQVYDVNN